MLLFRQFLGPATQNNQAKYKHYGVRTTNVIVR